MKTTIDHLLTPRFRVIGDYPKAEFQAGSLLVKIQYATEEIYHIDKYASVGGMNLEEIQKYPNLFQQLQWWEERKEEEMPKYLKISKDLQLPAKEFDYYKVYKWHIEKLFAQIDQDKMFGCSLTTFTPEYTYQPCSYEEYLANVKL